MLAINQRGMIDYNYSPKKEHNLIINKNYDILGLHQSYTRLSKFGAEQPKVNAFWNNIKNKEIKWVWFDLNQKMKRKKKWTAWSQSAIKDTIGTKTEDQRRLLANI